MNTQVQTSILDQIINEAMSLPVQTQTETMKLSPAYRGLANDLTSTPAKDFLSKSGLDWKVVPMPVATVGKTETRLIEGYKAMHRSDSGACLGIATDSYKPVQNAQMMEQFMEFAEAGNLTLSHAGPLDGGSKVFAVAKTDCTKMVEFRKTGDGLDYTAKQAARSAAGFKKGDMLTLSFVLSNGHTPGMSFKVKARGERIACMNGLTLSGEEVLFSMTHRSTYGQDQAQQIRRVIANALAAFNNFGNNADRMAQTPANRQINTCFIAELLQPELIKQAAERLLMPSAFATATVESLGQRVIDEILNRDEYVIDTNEFGRTTNKIIDSLDTQVGAELSIGTLWHGFNAVTYHVDHVSGRSADTGLQSALFGQGDQLKTKASNLAMQYVQRIAKAGGMN
jgi:hypothetical protein